MNFPKDASSTVSQNVVGSGTYNVRASEVAREKKQSSVNISIVLLDHTEVVFKVNKRDRGQVLLDLIFQHLRVSEVKFFGLQFPNDVPDSMRWLDPAKSIRKQFKRGYPYFLFFRVKFYATDILSMREEFTRYQLFLQLKLDLLEKRLQCPMSVAAMIASFSVQSELGDYNSHEHKNNYVSQFKFIPNQTEEFENEVKKLHKMHTGLTPLQAEYSMIKKAQKLDMYGVEMHHAKDNDEKDLDVGVTSNGMLLFQNGTRINHFKWSAIVKISFKRKQFYVQLRSPRNDANDVELVYSFHMDNYRACKRLWKSCVDFHSFYRLDRCMTSSCVHKHAANDGTSQTADTKSEKHLFGFLTLSGRGKYKDSDDGANVSPDDMTKHRRFLRSRVGSAKSKDNVGSFHGNGASNEEKAPRRLSAPPSMSYGVGETFISDEEMLGMLKHNGQLSYIKKPASNQNSNANSVESLEVVPSPAKIKIEMHSPDPALAVSYHQVHFRPEAVADLDETATSDISNMTVPESDCSSVMTSITEKSYVFPAATTLPFPHQSSSSHQTNGIPDGMVVIRIKPDEDGRYGFNVKGGADLNLPISVSKVAANSPASMCVPQLNEGDYVLQINGRDISSHSHDQVVKFIRSTRENHSGGLVLLVRPAQYKPSIEQPEVLKPLSNASFVRSDSVQDEGALLHKSMQWMKDMLDSGELLNMFEGLYRKKPGATMNDARLPSNIPKNRYRDISPYDNTRIHLKRGTTDYINANFVNMFIPGRDWTNCYIASQGPLFATTTDFWTMIWEYEVTFVVMLTTLVERGRPKCHQYWPDAGTTLQFGQWIIESVSEKVTPSFAYRDFKLQCIEDNVDETSPPRLISQMQYIAWPDHGVPDDSSDFLDFVLQVRQKRVGMAQPCVVHCSAGIGRTGVLITMETAMCLIEANQPVYPIEIARTMRDQRAMMIQTPSQFKFVCEAILRVYKEGLAKPLLEDDYEDQNGSEGDEQNDESMVVPTSINVNNS